MWTIVCICFWIYVPYRVIRSAKRGRIKQVNDEFKAAAIARVQLAEDRFNALSPQGKIKHLERQKVMAGVVAFCSGLIGFAISPAVGLGRSWYSGKQAESMCEDIDHEINQIEGQTTHS